MFLTIILTLWTVLHAYVFFRAASVPFVARRVPRRVLLLVAVGCWSSYVLARILEGAGVAAVAWPLELFGVHWLGALFLIAVCLLAVDLATGFGFLLPRRAPLLRGVALAAGGLLSLFALVQGLRPPVVDDEDVRMRGLPADADGLVVVAISDLHLGTLLGPAWLAARVAQVNALEPDLVVVLGDVFEGDRAAEDERELVPLLRRLRAPLGVWAVTGNHDSHGGATGALRVLRESGMRVLNDEWAEVRPGLLLAGVADPGHDGAADPASGVRRTLVGRPAGTATILLSHRPQQAAEAARAGATLMLAAHTHGGQLWPFNYLSGLVNPLMDGRYEVDGMPVIVCRGTGTWGPRMRLWRPSEILRITLRAP
jgi:hypothetical protein